MTPARVVIRAGAEDDGPALTLIDQATWSYEISPMPPRPAGTPFFDERTPPRNILVAHKDGHIVGFAQLRPAPMAASSGHVQELNGMAVAPEHQGRGIGHLLLDAVRDEAARRGGRRITLRVLGTNGRAQGLYLAHGYRIEGRLKGQYLLEGRYVDDIFMAFELAGHG
jgi:ribosomal protein S18 acetylase RimI-like enzyme